MHVAVIVLRSIFVLFRKSMSKGCIECKVGVDNESMT